MMAASGRSFEDFIEKEEKAFDDALQTFLKHELTDSGNYFDGIKEIARRYVKGEGEPEHEYDTLHKLCPDDEEEVKIETDESKRRFETYNFIKELFENYGLCHRAFLLLCAPYDDGDEFFREKEFESFVNIYPGISENKEKNPSVVKQVESYEDACEAIDDFFSGIGNNCILPQVIFNGHGTEGHGTEDGNVLFKTETILNNTFVEKVQQSCETHQHPRQVWPLAMRIVLAQCYSHKFSIETAHWVKVIPMSTVDKPIVFVRINKQKTDSKHIKLEEYGCRERQQVNQDDDVMTLSSEVDRTRHVSDGSAPNPPGVPMDVE